MTTVLTSGEYRCKFIGMLGGTSFLFVWSSVSYRSSCLLLFLLSSSWKYQRRVSCLLLCYEEILLAEMRKSGKAKYYSKYDVPSLIDGGS